MLGKCPNGKNLVEELKSVLPELPEQLKFDASSYKQYSNMLKKFIEHIKVFKNELINECSCEKMDVAGGSKPYLCAAHSKPQGCSACNYSEHTVSDAIKSCDQLEELLKKNDEEKNSKDVQALSNLIKSTYNKCKQLSRIFFTRIFTIL